MTIEKVRSSGEVVRGSVRVVVTGYTKDGRGVVVSDKRVAPFADPASHGYMNALAWAADAPTEMPNDGTPAPISTLSPPPGGVRFVLLTLLPGDEFDVEETTQSPRAGIHTMPDAPPGMHFTASVDFVAVIDGAVEMDLSDGVRVALGPGDMLVQNGTPHRWRNAGSVPARLAVVSVGSEHRLARLQGTTD